MVWIIVGVIGGTIFVLLVTFLLNTPESIMKAIVDKDDDKNDSKDQATSEDPKQ